MLSKWWYLTSFNLSPRYRISRPFLRCTWHPHIVLCSRVVSLFFSPFLLVIVTIKTQHYPEYSCPDLRGIKTIVSSCDCFGQIKQLLQIWSERRDVMREGFIYHESMSVIFITQPTPTKIKTLWCQKEKPSCPPPCTHFLQNIRSLRKRSLWVRFFSWDVTKKKDKKRTTML